MRKHASNLLHSAGAAFRSLLGRMGLPSYVAFTRQQLLRVARAACLVALLAVGADTARRASIEGSWRDLITKDREARGVALAAAPILVLTYTAGSSGGPAPHHMQARLDHANSSTGDGSRWEQGTFNWRWWVNGTIPTKRIGCFDPISGVPRWLDRDQHGSVGAAIVQEDGTAYLECEYINASGVSSGWVRTDDVTVTGSRTDIYADGAVGSSGDGNSWAGAYKTLNEACTGANTRGGNVRIWLRSCNCSANVNVGNVRIYCEKDPLLGSAVPRVTITANYNAFTSTSSTVGILVGEIEFYNNTGTSTARQGRVISFSDSQTNTNSCLWRTQWDSLDDVTVGEGAADIIGLSHICIRENASCTGQVHFTASTTGLKAWGVSIPLGSLSEHTYRLGHGGLYENEHHSFDYCLIANAETSKCWIRWYANQHLWVHGCDLRSRGYIGSHSPGDGAVGGTTVAFERCRFRTYSGQTTDFAVRLHSGWQEISFRACYFDGIVCLFVPRNNETASHTCNDNEWIGNDFRSGGGQSINWEYAATINTPLRQTVRNNRFRGGNSGSNRYLWFKASPTDYVLEGNIFERTNGQSIARIIATSTDRTFTQYTALTGVANETQVATMTVDSTTGEPDNGLDTGVTSSPQSFLSYYHARRFDPAASTYPSGAWLPADEAVTEHHAFLRIGGAVVALN